MGQPIPVVTLDYIYDSIARGERIDFDDPKYRYNGTRPQLAPAVTANKDNSAASRSFGGRNPFTESDREAIIAYFIDKPEASWSLNTAARELAKSNPTHTHSSYQSYLQNNFERGWNLKEQVLLARRAALEDEPSELQARILRSQYTASPGPAEQSAPSDGWPHTSSAPSQQGSEEQRSRHRQEQEAPHEEASPAEDDDEDLQVRQPNPGAAVHDVDKSPTKANKPVVYASSDHSGSRQNSVEPPPSGQRMTIPASPPVEEESDPNDFSPTILDQIERAERLKSSQPKPSQKQRRARHSSDSSDDSELDQLDADSDEDMLTTGPAALAPEVERNGADASEDSEWEGTRRAENKMREKDDSFVREKRIKFTKEEKDELLRNLVDHVLSEGRAPDVFTQEAILAKPEDAFWAQFAQDNPTHSLASWRSHYLKNRATYKQMIDLMIADRIEATEGSPAGEDDDDVDEEEGEEQSMAVEPAEALDQSNEQPLNEQNSDADENVLLKELQSATRRQDDPSMEKSNLVLHLEDMSLPADGIVVMIPTQPVQDQRRPRRTKPQPTQKQQWPQAPTPPLMEEEEQADMMQVEAEIDAVADEPDRAPNDSNDDITSSREDIQGLHEQPAAVEGLDSAESMEEGEAPVISLGKTPSTSALPKASTPTRSIQPPQKKGVDAGTPVLSQHRDAPFYDFTIDSDEEHRIRKARSRPSLPNLPSSRQEATASRTSRSPITSKRVLSHFATPSRSRTHADNVRKDQTPQQQQREDDPTESIREWARSVSTTPSSASPDLLKDAGPVVIAETSRSRASRIDRPMEATLTKSAVTALSSADTLPPFVIHASSSRPSTSKNNAKSQRRLRGSNTPSKLVHYSSETYPASSSARLSRYAPTFTKDDMDVDGDDMEAGDAEQDDVRIAVAGTSIASSHVFMKGHGTFLSSNSDEILSSMCGTVERVNKLISVRPARSRYAAEVGDLVIGRITEVGPKRWKVDINAKTDSALQLSSINLPGGIQRRKVESDELQMRNFFQENDLLVAEVQMMFQDNSSALHTRSLRYGKLKNGILVTAAPNLIQRLKSHFVHLKDDELSLDVDLIIGLNGYIWIAKHFPYNQPSNSSGGPATTSEQHKGLAGSGVGMDIDATYSDQNDADLSVELRRQIQRVAKCIHVLDAYHHPISDVTIHSLVSISTAYLGHILQQQEQQDWHRDANLTSLMMEQLRSGSTLAD
ncbi:hypothetical protein NDA16_005184 [Ustilago loliicola]|nr:hypothetical protein NDA16_005184 [Ustilago loliicola]